MESDEAFLNDMEQWVIGSLVFKKEHRDRLFALARRGAAVPHTDDKRAHSTFANSENASKGEQRTICEACGNANLAHDRAAWADDGASYCPKCFRIILAGPLPPPPAGEPSDE